jgi:glucose/mannose-6-phosphate isomerase
MNTLIEGFRYESDTWSSTTPPSHAVIFGMGGSSLPARLIASLPDAPKMTLVSDYAPGQQHRIHESDRTIFISYSGETEEVLEAIKYHKTLDSAVITTGGSLLAYAHEHNIAAYVIPTTNQEPRDAVGYMTKALMHALHMKESFHRLATLEIPEGHMNERAESLTSFFAGRVPLIYSGVHQTGIAYYLKITLNETAKMHAFVNTLPELCHNELEAFTSTQNLTPAPVFMIDPNDHPRVALRASLLEDILKEAGIETRMIALRGETPEARMVEGVVLSSMVGDALARSTGITSHETPRIASLKKSLHAS